MRSDNSGAQMRTMSREHCHIGNNCSFYAMSRHTHAGHALSAVIKPHLQCVLDSYPSLETWTYLLFANPSDVHGTNHAPCAVLLCTSHLRD